MLRRALSSRPRRPVIAVAHLLAIVVVGIADFLSGPDYELRPFYLLPVLSAGWFGGRLVGVMTAVAASIALFLANDYVGVAILKGYAIPAWNSVSRLTTYVVIAVLAALIREQADALTAKTAALVRESALREEYIALFVHELRHSAAATSLAVASLVTSPRIADDDRAYLERLRQQARDLEQLARQLLAVGPLEGGKLRLNMRELDLRDLVASAVGSSPAPERLAVRAPADPVPARGDPEELERALGNYIRNALMYSPASAPVTVEVVRRDGRVGVEVRDEGIGFEPGQAAGLFRKYGRLHNTRGSNPEGAGLGLYLTRLIVEAHGGEVRASSAGPGAGARFAFLLPSVKP